jgi:hypothetical protein
MVPADVLQVLFSSSIMYGNFMTIDHRAFIRKIAEENEARIAMVRACH